MKKIIFLLLAVIMPPSAVDFAQNQYSYPTSGFIKENNFGDWIKYTSSGGSGYWEPGHKVGVWYASDLGKWDETRNINNWTWSYNDIPTLTSVTSVRIRFRAHDQAPNNFQITINNINHVWGDNNFDYYSSFSTANEVYTTTVTPDQSG